MPPPSWRSAETSGLHRGASGRAKERVNACRGEGRHPKIEAGGKALHPALPGDTRSSRAEPRDVSARIRTALSLSRSAILGCRRYHKYLFFQPLLVRRGRAAPAPSRRAEQRAERRTTGTGGPGGGGPRPSAGSEGPAQPPRSGLPSFPFSFLFPFFSLFLPLSPARNASGRGAAPTPSARRGSAGKCSLSKPPPHPPPRFLSPRLC